MTAADSPFDGPAIAASLAALPGWEHVDGVIRRTYQTGGWRGSLIVANAIGFICEAADHHADVLVTWPRVTVSLSTHSAGGITAKDFEVAQRIERHLTWKPALDSSLTGPVEPLVR
ncbi:MAG: 4a-hydroxytetrahydrobiopterin dehydratase [Gemmatimonadetes bacterium]|nr:4a-hydroxytetrahydrobiopterin dehydratase [Gemmatimonadota bacterium]